MNFLSDDEVPGYNKGYSDSEYLEFLDSDVSTIDEEGSLTSTLSSLFVPSLLVSNTICSIATDKFIWCSDYAQDILETLKEIEKKRQKICYKSPQVGARLNLIQLIKTTAETLGLGRTTVHLSIYMLDVFMDYYKIITYKLNAVALMCLLLAAKTEECDSKIPKFDRLRAMVDEDYTKSDFKAIEVKILQFFKWYLLFPTGATFLESYVANVIDVAEFNVYSIGNNLKTEFKTLTEMSININSIVFEFLDLTLQDRRLVQVLPSMLSAGCLAAARKNSGIFPIWNERLTKLTGYSYENIAEIVDTLGVLKAIIDEQEKMKNTPDSGFLSENSESEDDEGSFMPMTCTLPFKRRRC